MTSSETPTVVAAPTPERILVVGSGAREHALAWRLSREAGVRRVLVAPGNPLAADVAEPLASTDVSDAAGIVETCDREAVDLVVVGPEAPLVAGLADRLRVAGFAVFGPDAGAAAVEGSKSFCRAIAEAAGIPMADGRSFERPDEAIGFARQLGGRVVVKADGLAAGKGVSVCASQEEAASAIRDALVERRFGDAGRRVVVERALSGTEGSVIAICDGTTALALPAARDHKRLREGDAGPNTGGMGAYSPVGDVDDGALSAIVERFHEPALRALAERGTPFRGALFAGLMLTEAGPVLLEFNARLGDPETQVLMPRLSSPLAPLLLAAASGRLAERAAALAIRGSRIPAVSDAAVGVVLAADGYPGAPRTGDGVTGIDEARATGALVFGAGLARAFRHGPLVTRGGRVLTVVGVGPTVDDAARTAYAGADRIDFPGRQLRRDVGRTPAVVAA